jgi:hypothetical protein
MSYTSRGGGVVVIIIIYIFIKPVVYSGAD